MDVVDVGIYTVIGAFALAAFVGPTWPGDGPASENIAPAVQGPRAPPVPAGGVMAEPPPERLPVPSQAAEPNGRDADDREDQEDDGKRPRDGDGRGKDRGHDDGDDDEKDDDEDGDDDGRGRGDRRGKD